jgi:hypothetical protein
MMNRRIFHFGVITAIWFLVGIAANAADLMHLSEFSLGLIGSTLLNLAYAVQLAEGDARRAETSQGMNVTLRPGFPVAQFFVVGAIFAGVVRFSALIVHNANGEIADGLLVRRAVSSLLLPSSFALYFWKIIRNANDEILP